MKKTIIFLLFCSIPISATAATMAALPQVGQTTVPSFKRAPGKSKPRVVHTLVYKWAQKRLKKTLIRYQEDNGKRESILGLSCSLLAIVCVVFPIAALIWSAAWLAFALILSITGLVLSIIGFRKSRSWEYRRKWITALAVAGIVLSSLLLLIFGTVLLWAYAY